MQISNNLPVQFPRPRISAPAPLPEPPVASLPTDQASLDLTSSLQDKPALPATSELQVDTSPKKTGFDQLLDDLRDAVVSGVTKRSRGLPPEKKAVLPARPKLFPAGAVELKFRNPQGNEQNVLFDAVGKIGNLYPIVPGETLIPGARISWKGNDLTQEQGERLLGQLYANFAQKQTDEQLLRLQEAVNKAAAIVYNGAGQEAVEKSFQAGVASVESLRSQFPEKYPG